MNSQEAKALEDIATLLDDSATRELEILSVDSRRAGSSSSQVLSQYSGRTDRVVGCLLGAMAGDALGVQVEPEPHYRLTRLFPEGVQDFWSFDVNTTKVQVAPGCVTGDFLLMTAVARSLAAQGHLDLLHMLDCMQATYGLYPNHNRRYTPYGCMVIEAVCQGVDLGAVAQRAEELLDLTPARNARSSSNREDQQRVGAGDATAVLRVTPIALAYAGERRLSQPCTMLYAPYTTTASYCP
jgi:ADP-ribosylglycohydrolase